MSGEGKRASEGCAVGKVSKRGEEDVEAAIAASASFAHFWEAAGFRCAFLRKERQGEGRRGVAGEEGKGKRRRTEEERCTEKR